MAAVSTECSHQPRQQCQLSVHISHGSSVKAPGLPMRRNLRSRWAKPNAFVLPTRGEGWCLPCVEAMSMSLPILVTNFSGVTEYMTKENSYGIEYELNEKKNAEPNIFSLMKEMKSIVVNPMEGIKRGRQARLDVVRKYAVDVIAKRVWDRLTVLWFTRSKTSEGHGEL